MLVIGVSEVEHAHAVLLSLEFRVLFVGTNTSPHIHERTLVPTSMSAERVHRCGVAKVRQIGHKL